MYLDESTTTLGKKTYRRYLLRESYRENGKVKKRTIANLSHCTPKEIEAISLALSQKNNLQSLKSQKKSSDSESHSGAQIDLQRVTFAQGPSFGAVYTLHEMAKRLGLIETLGSSREGKLALWQVLARIIQPGSRLSSVRLAQSHAACDVLGLESFHEEHLYENLNWLCDHQAEIENGLFQKRWGSQSPSLSLYDVTSSYFEGTQNAFAAFGYNRDRKKGKLQMVIGLLCDPQGKPISIQVFPGNTTDPKTVTHQLDKISKRFGGLAITLVGDRGMIKGPQKKEVFSYAYHYITAITKPQIKKLLKEGAFQMDFFTPELSEVSHSNKRYVLKLNPIRANEIKANRDNKFYRFTQDVQKQNLYLKNHPRAQEATALKKLQKRASQLKISSWVNIKMDLIENEVILLKDPEAYREVSQLDGCYALETDLTQEQMDKKAIHDRYKDLSKVEWAFRTLKTNHLEIRPVYLRQAERTRAHVFVAMMSYLIIQELSSLWEKTNLTVTEAIAELSSLCIKEIKIDGHSVAYALPEPREMIKNLLKMADIVLPLTISLQGVHVDTRKKLNL